MSVYLITWYKYQTEAYTSVQFYGDKHTFAEWVIQCRIWATHSEAGLNLALAQPDSDWEPPAGNPDAKPPPPEILSRYGDIAHWYLPKP